MPLLRTPALFYLTAAELQANARIHKLGPQFVQRGKIADPVPEQHTIADFGDPDTNEAVPAAVPELRATSANNSNPEQPRRGRPPVTDEMVSRSVKMITEYQAAHPTATMQEVADATGLSRRSAFRLLRRAKERAEED